MNTKENYGKSADVVFIITEDSAGMYEPNTEITAKRLVEDYIDGLCLNEPNDKDVAEWLTSYLRSDNVESANYVVRFISIMWGLDVIGKAN